MRFGRKSSAQTESVDLDEESGSVQVAETPTEEQVSSGPLDVADLDPDTVYIDLGSLLVPPSADLELRLQVEEGTGEVLAVLLVADEGVLETRAFASSRGGDLWAEARAEIAADTASRGGTAVEQEGPFGTELYCEVPVVAESGEKLIQPSRIIGHNGPRWFVRATIAGRPAKDPDYARPFEDAIRSMAVRRGNEAMAPGAALPLQLPPEARQQASG